MSCVEGKLQFTSDFLSLFSGLGTNSAGPSSWGVAFTMGLFSFLFASLSLGSRKSKKHT